MTEQGRILALDYGRARTGVAVSDALGISVTPLPSLLSQGRFHELLPQVQDLVTERQISLVLLGRPIGLSGQEGTLYSEILEFGQRLAQLLALPVMWLDERFTTHEAEHLLREQGLSSRQRKQKKDSVAAALILQSYLANPALAESVTEVV